MRVERLEKEYDIAVEWRGIEIHAEIPTAGIPRETFMRGHYCPQIEDNVRALAVEAGISMRSPAVIANTHLALEAAEFARDHGAFDWLHRRLFEAYFQEGVNIGEIEALVRLAGEVGLDASGLRRALADHRYRTCLEVAARNAERDGVPGTPTFFVGKQRVIGAQPYDVLEKAAVFAGAKPRNETRVER